jgi:ATP-dependent helicase/nuclease subunit A
MTLRLVPNLPEPTDNPADHPAEQSSAQLADAAARTRIATDLNTTLFVEAGAGSGKTTTLVERVVALVASGIPVEAIAAITFTEKAAAELRARVRARLIELIATAEPADRSKFSAALDSLDQAAIGTLHAFARRLLARHPIEAGLPPAIDVLDEISSQLAFDERWRDELELLLADADTDPHLRDALLYADVSGVKATHLRDLAITLGRDIDRLGRWLPDDAPPVKALPIDDLPDRFEALAALRLDAESRWPDDRMVQRLRGFEALARELRRADTYRALDLLTHAKVRGYTTLGKKDNFKSPSKDEINRELTALADDIDARLAVVKDSCINHLVVVLGRRELSAADGRRAAGRLQFDDLLVSARALLRHPEHGRRVRAENHAHFQRILLDEFQDTDPIQLEIAVLITGDPDDPAIDWRDRTPVPGHLFMVGDPKQSIYRFRRADIATFLAARDQLADEPIQLTSNFRTCGPIITWVNDVFRQLLQEREGAQAGFVPLDATRPAPTVGPAVVRFGTAHTSLNADAVRVTEASDVASLIASSADWTVERKRQVTNEHGETVTVSVWEPRRLSDITVLLPTRLSLPALEEALDESGIAFRAETSSLIFATREVRDLLLAARAIDDPSDELALVSALRTPLFGCSDVDLAHWKRTRNGSWNLLDTTDDERFPPRHNADEPDRVRDAMVELRRLHDARVWLTPAEVLDQLAIRRSAFELGTLTSRNRDVWRRLRFLIDQARAWSDAGGRTLREFLAWCTRQGAEGTHLSPAVLPETDDDAVRLMTVHAAKGLEFPIVILAGLSTARRRGAAGVTVRWFEGRPEVKLRLDLTTSSFDPAIAFEDQMDHEERLRLLYVASTRARDHLAVSVHRVARKKPTTDDATKSNAEILAEASLAATQDDWVAGDGSPVAFNLPTFTGSIAAITALPFNPDTWAADHVKAVAHAAKRTSLSPSGLAKLESADDLGGLGEVAPGLAKDPRPLDLPPWNRGRYGTAIGRAVHGTLQHVSLKTGAGIRAIAASQAAAEAVPGHAETVEALAKAALASATVKEAAANAHWREMFVGTTVGDRVLEGYIDLLYRTDAGYVVVDYKTDRVTDADLDDRVDKYRLQGAAYALAVEQVVGAPVVSCRFVFCREDGAIERELPDLRAAIADVIALMSI